MITGVIVRIISVLLAGLLLLTGCANLLEDYVETITPHEIAPYERPPVELPAITNLSALKDLVLELVMTHEHATTVHYIGIDNEETQETIQQMPQEILQSNPTAAYAVADIILEATRFVSYTEINIEIEFKRTAEQINTIINASTQRYLITQLLDIMSQYKEEVAFLTNLRLEKNEIEAQIAELYYQNPRSLVMMPIITVEVFPENAAAQTEEDDYRIYEIKFGYPEDTDILRGFGSNLSTSIRTNAARADGDTDGEILLSIVQNIIAGAEYDESAASTIAMHGQQNIAATAFGTLVRGFAVGEGFAMAFKALCDEMRLDCRIVLGKYEGDIFHAWNVVALEGDYYHIDTAMCALNGLEAGFLKTDDDFFDKYSWDKSGTPRCNGPLTLTDLLPPSDINIPDGTEELPAES